MIMEAERVEDKEWFAFVFTINIAKGKNIFSHHIFIFSPVFHDNYITGKLFILDKLKFHFLSILESMNHMEYLFHPLLASYSFIPTIYSKSIRP